MEQLEEEVLAPLTRTNPTPLVAAIVAIILAGMAGVAAGVFPPPPPPRHRRVPQQAQPAISWALDTNACSVDFRIGQKY